MRFAYYDRLSPARKEIYRRSDAIATLDLPPGIAVAQPVLAIGDGLSLGHRATVQKGAQTLIDTLVFGFAVPPVDVRVLAVRPSDMDGELHGLYEPDEEVATARISVWMRTAQKRQVVAFRSFLRTVVHEFLHHLDYEHFGLPETFHTEGFYKRESSLANALFGINGIAASAPAASGGFGKSRL
ncbi:MAG: hypothetical protein IT521_15795 [Burkholderiales bacterium]|nr:hypothetical protein [Burkholderiales bacterium]